MKQMDEDSNITYFSNVYVIHKDFSASRGDDQFLKQVKGFPALAKLRAKQGGNTNTSYYTFTYDQLKTVAPQFEAVYAPQPKEDPEITRENRKYDEQYGLSDMDHRKFYPLQNRADYEELTVDTASKNQKEKLIGKWKPMDSHNRRAPNKKNNPVFYAFRELEKEKLKEDQTVDTRTADLDGVDLDDPYYYVYRKTATSKPSEYDASKAEIYLKKYGFDKAFQTCEQNDIITAPVEQNTFVNAGPGTGKTYTLIQKINYLVAQAGVDPESMPVLCFTRAAVDEVKKRLQKFVDDGGPRNLINVDVRTFHSFAWWLISSMNDAYKGEAGYHEIAMESLSYDSSIVKATQLIEMYSDDIFANWTHFIVDEVQDLTDIRAHFVLAIVKGCLKKGAGVTVFGDSCQAIYDYNQDVVKSPMTSMEFYADLFKMMFGKAEFCRLTLNHRQSDVLIAATEGMRSAILSEDMERMREETGKLLTRIRHEDGKYISESITIGRLDELRDGGRICLMCRNNAEVLSLSTNLRKRGISHVVNAYDNSDYFAGWVGAVFGGYDKDAITYDAFEDRLNAYGLSSSRQYWNRLNEIMGKDDDILRVQEILKSIYRSNKDDSIIRNKENGDVIVSNIHRSKGREYDCVMLDSRFVERLANGDQDKHQQGKQFRDKDYRMVEYKALYVAITRARKKLLFASLVRHNCEIYVICKTGRKRWMNMQKHRPNLFEVRANTDFDISSCFSREIQRYIVHNVHNGDEIRLDREISGDAFQYRVIHVTDDGETKIGLASSTLLEDLAVMTHFESRNGTKDVTLLPSSINDLYVTGRYTQYKIAENTGKMKVWVWPDFCGLGHMTYDIY